jgi:ribonucleoside-diphosphate reductase beta chain
MEISKYFNPQGEAVLDEKLYGGNPTGFIDFNRSRYHWSRALYNQMNAQAWFPAEVNTEGESKSFARLSENEQNIYRYTFAQLSYNDSAQSQYLLDFIQLANNRIVKAVLTLQAAQEVLHSDSYAVLLDAAGNSNEVFDLYKHDEALKKKNLKIAEHFARHIEGGNTRKMLLSSMASVNLEGIYFLLGFAYIYTLGDKVPGARKMIQFIARDELQAHLPIFANIFKTLIKKTTSIEAL